MTTRAEGIREHVLLEVMETVRMRLRAMCLADPTCDRVALTMGMMFCDPRCTKEEAVEAAFRTFPREGPAR